MPYSGSGDRSHLDPIFAGRTANGILEITGGAYAAATGTVGRDVGVTGTMTATGGTTSITIGGGGTDGQFYVGASGTGTLNIASGATFTSTAAGGYKSMSIGENATGNGIVNVTGTGSQLIVGGEGSSFAVGRNGDAELNVTGGATVETFFLETARFGTSNSSVLISGPGSRIDITDVGNFAAPYAGEAGIFRLGREAGSKGYLEINSGGVLDIANVDGVSDGTILELARVDGSYGRIDLDGAGSTINVTQNGAAGDDYTFGSLMRIGRQGQGVVEMTTGSQLNVTGDNATFIISDAGNQSGNPDAVVDPTSQLLILSGSDVTVDAGAAPSAVYGGNHGRVYVGRNANGRGEIVVDGIGSTLDVSGFGGGITLGRDGQGELTVSGGADVSATNYASFSDPTPGDPTSGDEMYAGGFQTFELGRNSGSVGTATITGVGSTLTVTGDDQKLAVGHFGTGTLNVTYGGEVTAHFLDAARHNGSIGNTVVDGAGSAIRLSSVNGQFLNPAYSALGAQARWGREGGSQGSLTITDGGLVDLRNEVGVTAGAYVTFARNDNSVGNLTIDGVSSTLNVETLGGTLGPDGYGASVELGRNGQSTAIVRNSGQLNVLGIEAALGVGVTNDSFSNPDVVDDANSTLTIQSGGDVLVDSGTYAGAKMGIGEGANGDGDVVVDGVGSTLILDGVTSALAIGAEGSNGTLTIQNGGVVSNQGTTANIFVAGGGPGGYGTITVDGATSSLFTTDKIFLGDPVAGMGGQGVLLLNNGGSVTADSVEIGNTSGIAGTGGTVNGNVLMNGSGVLAPGDPGPGLSGVGTLAITGNLTIDDGSLIMGISGVGVGQHDVINIGGTANLNNVEFELDLLGGFTPVIGDQATLVTAGTDLTFDATAASFYGASTQAFSVADTGTDLVVTALNSGSGAAILDLGAGSPATNATVTGTGQGFTSTGVAFTNVTEIRGTNQNDVINASAATSGLTLVGRNGADNLTGGSGDDLLNGGLGGDTLTGGGGVDTVTYADSNAGVTVNMAASTASGGHANGDVLAGIENLIGSNFGDNLTAGAGNNVLNGGTGSDTLAGGTDDDTYILDSYGDVVVEAIGEGFDTIQTSFNVFATGGAEIERIETTNAAGFDPLVLVGNEFNQVIVGNEGVNALSGLGGIDSTYGGGGNDFHIVDNALDLVFEAVGEGVVDGVYTTVNYTLQAGSEIERFVATPFASSNDVELTGNEFGQVMVGNQGNNVINGEGGIDSLYGFGGNDFLESGAGNDNLFGGTGLDTFLFSEVQGTAGGIDRIYDLTAADDIRIDSIAQVGLVALTASQFQLGTAADDADDRVIYDDTTGVFWFDADGNGAGAAILFGVVNGAPSGIDHTYFELS